jgi:hypothetical protein
MTCAVLVYHSHNVFGDTYDRNDHVALQSDLISLTELGAHIVPLADIAERVVRGDLGGDQCFVGLSFDDGPIFDFHSFVHPSLGVQRGFAELMRDFAESPLGSKQPQLHATSFVIASPEARRAMERAEECGYTYLFDWLSDHWWSEAGRSGMLEIANHSWDHVHGAVPSTALTTSSTRNDFTVVSHYIDADREIRRASSYIRDKVGSCRFFAFPFGHSNDFLVEEYLPERQAEHGCRAAFGAQGRIVQNGDSVWNIPRMICGHHWRSPEELRRLLNLQESV